MRKRLLAFLVLVLLLLSGCRKEENIEYDNSLLDYDMAVAGEISHDDVYSFFHNGELSASGETYVYEEDSIQKGYFYIVRPQLRLDDSSPSDAVVEAVYNLDYEVLEDNMLRFHTFTMEFEEINCEFHDLTLTAPNGKVIPLSVSDDNKIQQTIDYTEASQTGHVLQTMFWIKGTITYEGEDYKFSQHF